MNRLFHVGIGGATLTPEGIAQIERALGTVDWYRNGAYSWIIYGAGSLDEWRDYLREVPSLQGSASFFLCEISSYSGYLNQGGWDWLKGK